MGCAPWFEFKVLENKLRPSSVAVRRHLPPKGKALYTENKLRPLIFKNSFRNIQIIKNGLRIKCYAPHHLAPQGASPPGEASERGTYL